MNLAKTSLILFLSCASFISKAQLKHILGGTTFQIELGKHYLDLADRRTKYDEKFALSTRSSFPFPSTANPADPSSAYFAIKAFYKRHTIIFRHSGYMSSRVSVPYPETGFSGFSMNIDFLGYGYKIIDKKLKVYASFELCIRSGNEHYITLWYVNGSVNENRSSDIFYQNPWGFSSTLDAEYLFTKNLGVGLNLGYVVFPFEETKLSGSDADLNPVLRDNTLPNQKVILGTIKILYHFSLVP